MLERNQDRIFRAAIISWYRRAGRKFSWRESDLSSWQWLFLEVLLRKTRAEAVEKIYIPLVRKYSCPNAVLRASDEELEKDLKILGLYRQRCRSLKAIAEKIVKEFNGEVPNDLAALASLPSVGPYISNAVLCFCYGQRRPVVDVNVARVICRYKGLKTQKDNAPKWLWDLAETMLPKKNWNDYNYGLLDLGAMFCTSQKPNCTECCLIKTCATGASNLNQITI